MRPLAPAAASATAVKPHLSNLDLLARQAARAAHLAATDANPYLARTNNRLAELRAFEQAYGQQTRSIGYQQKA